MGWVVSDLDYEGMICEYEMKTAQQVVKMVFFVDLTSLPLVWGNADISC
jgi:hypothetical protein